MTVEVRSFSELELLELYAVLRLRAEVFVVEQNCVYQDIDNKDQHALHVLGYVDEELVAYTRLFRPGVYFKKAAIGRVLVRRDQRHQQLGHRILEASIKLINERYSTTEIVLSAQTYLIAFYQAHGFQTKGESYLEDGIPHVFMEKLS